MKRTCTFSALTSRTEGSTNHSLAALSLLTILTMLLLAPSALASNPDPPQRGQPLSSPLNAKEMHQAFLDMKAEYQKQAMNKNGWKVLQNVEGMEVALLPHPDDPFCPYIRMTTELPVPPQQTWDFMRIENWHKSMPQMNPYFEGHSVHGHRVLHKVDMTLCRIRLKRLGPFGKRDQVFLSIGDTPERDGTMMSGTVSVETSLVPRVPGYTRAFQNSIGIYEPHKISDTRLGTKLTIIFRIDLNDRSGEGGLIPMFLYVKTVGITGIQSMKRMRQALQSFLDQQPTDSEASQGRQPWLPKLPSRLSFPGKR